MSKPMNILLIHGAWAGSWVWDKLQPRLQSLGYSTCAVDLPGNGRDDTPAEQVTLDLYVQYAQERIEKEEGPWIIISHSGAGVLATAIGEALPERIAGIVYIAGMMLPSGIGFSDLINRLKDQYPEVAGIGPHLLWNSEKTLSQVPPSAAREIFFQDLNDEEAVSAAERLTAQPEGGRSMVAQWTAERVGKIPRLYIEATLDQSVVLPLQRAMQEDIPDAHVESLVSGHAPQVSMPDEVIRVLTPFLRNLSL
jgi:pimeloyl-ACP methyl ester carboxylesterase